MTNTEMISLILTEMERNSILQADKTKALISAVSKLQQARIQEAEGVAAQRLAEDEIIILQGELVALESINKRNADTLRGLQQAIALAEAAATPVTPAPVEEPVVEPIEESTPEDPAV
jgi:hypothetical protein